MYVCEYAWACEGKCFIEKCGDISTENDHKLFDMNSYIELESIYTREQICIKMTYELFFICFIYYSITRNIWVFFLFFCFNYPRKHMLWVRIKVRWQGASNEYVQHSFSSRNKKLSKYFNP